MAPSLFNDDEHPTRPAAADPRVEGGVDRRAIARERLAERARRVRTLRKRAAGGAVAVFLAAWLAIFVPTQRDAVRTSAQSASAGQATAGDDTSTSTSLYDDSYDSGTYDDGAYGAPAAAPSSSGQTAVAPAPMTSGQS